MKKLLSFSLLAVIVLVFYGCPIGLDYSLGSPGAEKIDPALLGTWKIDETMDGEVLKLKISKGDATSYKVEVLERGEMYSLSTDDLTGWVTKVNGENFLYVKPSDEEKFYHYHYEVTGKKLVIHDVALLDGGVDAISSTETLRSQVERSMTKEGWGKEKLEYTKQ
jgi:hypothetical protein